LFFYGYRKKYSNWFGFIPEGFHVHHINGRRWDNRRANLVAIPAALHSLHHKTKRAGGWHWLTRSAANDAKSFARAAEEAQVHLHTLKMISIFYRSRGNKKKTEQALRFFNSKFDDISAPFDWASDFKAYSIGWGK